MNGVAVAINIYLLLKSSSLVSYATEKYIRLLNESTGLSFEDGLLGGAW